VLEVNLGAVVEITEALATDRALYGSVTPS
jgi:hypothetical protein